MKTSDIPDGPIMRYLAKQDGIWSMNYPPTPGYNFGYIGDAMPDVCHKLRLSKMRSLIRRGLARGCTCGCRGDFEITDKGREFVRSLGAD